ncbi:MAG: hypothetical protein ACXWC6_05180 [Ramlibacter sp.]
MGFIDRLMGKAAARSTTQPGARTTGAQGPTTQGASSSPQTVRKELVRVAGRDTLHHNGIPADWIRIEPLTMAAPSREPGVHVRLVVLHWDPRLMLHAIALQQNMAKRIAVLDPLCDRWLMGVSWQFELKHQPEFGPLPHPGSWTSAPPDYESLASGSTPAPTPEPAGGDVISGPTHIGKQGSDARRDLERLLGERDADFQKSDHGGFEKTQPMKF